jgi:hypothetical protein
MIMGLPHLGVAEQIRKPRRPAWSGHRVDGQVVACRVSVPIDDQPRRTRRDLTVIGDTKAVRAPGRF